VPDRLDSRRQVPLLVTLDLLVAKTDFTWPWRKPCTKEEAAWLRVFCTFGIGKQVGRQRLSRYSMPAL
jgi:hypothetical protein